jgi:uncharacterized protein
VIIDVHGHLGPWFFSPSEGTASANLRAMDAYGIDIQLVSSVEAINYDPQPGNASLADAIADQPRLRGLFVIDPRELDRAEIQLAGLLSTGLFVGAKIHTHYSATPAGSPAMADALRLCAAAGLPVLVHTWGPDILDLASTVASVDGVRAIAGHMGGPDWRLAPEAVSRTDRLWLEPCYSRPDAGRIRWVLDRIDPRRMLFGSDSTLIDPGYALGAMLAASLSPEEQRLIMQENARTLFRL